MESEVLYKIVNNCLGFKTLIPAALFLAKTDKP